MLIHDAQHTVDEYEPKRHWGHCTVEYALHVAREAGVRNLVLFHHDPLHGDDEMDRIANHAGELGARMGIPEVTVARDGLVLHLAAHPAENRAAGAQ
jgi:ribonuclease BN (tRNA processing enzyme)